MVGGTGPRMFSLGFHLQAWLFASLAPSFLICPVVLTLDVFMLT